MLSNAESAGVVQKYIREMFGFIDRLVYGIMAFLFEVFFNVANQDIIKGETVKALIGRFQLILGIVFLFVFAVHIIQGIINPDTFTDSNNGSSKIIMKVIITLLLFASMIPLNVPAGDANDHSWNSYLANQGILFGTLSSFQYRVLETNLLGKLILGSSNSTYSNNVGFDEEADVDSTDTVGKYTASEIAKLFVFPNMHPDAKSKDDVYGTDEGAVNDEDYADYADKPATVCIKDEGFYKEDEESPGAYQEYLYESDPDKIFRYVDYECETEWHLWGWLTGAGDVWQFQYLAPLSTVVGVIVVLILISYTLEIAIRVFKLAILRIIGPVAAISYVIPGKNNMFNSWVTMYTSTYLDIFVRLATMYFVIFVMASVLGGDLSISIFDAGTGVGICTLIFLIIGLLMFAKQAPGYVRQALGIKEDAGKGMFKGLAAMAGIGAAAGGALGSGISRVRASMDKTDKTNPGNRLVNGAKHLAAGIGGFSGGLIAGSRAALNADSGQRQAALDAVHQRNALKLAQVRADSTALGRVKDRVGTFLGGGETPLEQDNRAIAKQEAIAATGEDLSNYMKDRALKENGTQQYTMMHNGSAMQASLSSFINAREAAKARGSESFSYNGQNFDTRSGATDDFEDLLASRSLETWVRREEATKAGGGSYSGSYQSLLDKQNSYMNNGGSLPSDNTKRVNIKDVRTSAKVAGAEATRIKNSQSYMQHQANNPNGPVNK